MVPCTCCGPTSVRFALSRSTPRSKATASDTRSSCVCSDVARDLQLQRLFVLTFETDFFARHGFTEIDGTPVTAEVYEEMCRSFDIGVAEFLDLSYVKPNILGNSRMLLVL